jgi:hypothetical protein
MQDVSVPARAARATVVAGNFPFRRLPRPCERQGIHHESLRAGVARRPLFRSDSGQLDRRPCRAVPDFRKAVGMKWPCRRSGVHRLDRRPRHSFVAVKFGPVQRQSGASTPDPAREATGRSAAACTFHFRSRIRRHRPGARDGNSTVAGMRRHGSRDAHHRVRARCQTEADPGARVASVRWGSVVVFTAGAPDRRTYPTMQNAIDEVQASGIDGGTTA